MTKPKPPRPLIFSDWLKSKGTYKEKYGPLKGNMAIQETKFVAEEDDTTKWRLLTNKGWYDVLLYSSAAISFKVYDNSVSTY